MCVRCHVCVLGVMYVCYRSCMCVRGHVCVLGVSVSMIFLLELFLVFFVFHFISIP
jgi:hypothetical protein